MDDENENSRSLSGYTDSTEQSAAVNFDMSNRVGKLNTFKPISNYAIQSIQYHFLSFRRNSREASKTFGRI